MQHKKDASAAKKEEGKGQGGISVEAKHLQPEAEQPVRVTDKRFWAQAGQGPDSPQTGEVLLEKPHYVEELERKLAESQKQLDEVMASYRQFKAEATVEAQKARQRIQNDYNRRVLQSSGDMAKKFITVLENLDRAVLAAEAGHSFESLLEGVKLIQGQFSGALRDLGLEEIPVLNLPFNPEVAEAVEMVLVPDTAKDNLVVEVASNGYRISDFLVRPARVKVGKAIG
jgi:molecular chaperone GrpE